MGSSNSLHDQIISDMAGQIYQPLLPRSMQLRGLITDTSDLPLSFSQLLSSHDYMDKGMEFSSLASPDSDRAIVETIPKEDRAALLPILKLAFPTIKHTKELDFEVGHGLGSKLAQDSFQKQHQAIFMNETVTGVHCTLGDGMHHPPLRSYDVWHQQVEARQLLSTGSSKMQQGTSSKFPCLGCVTKLEEFPPFHFMSMSCKPDGWHHQAVSQDVSNHQIGDGNLQTCNVLLNTVSPQGEANGLSNALVCEQSNFDARYEGAENELPHIQMPELVDQYSKYMLTNDSRKDQLYPQPVDVMENQFNQHYVWASDTTQHMLPVSSYTGWGHPASIGHIDGGMHHQSSHAMQARQNMGQTHYLGMSDMGHRLPQAVMAMQCKQVGLYHQAVPIKLHKQVVGEVGMEKICSNFDGHLDEAPCLMKDLPESQQGPDSLFNFQNPMCSSYSLRTLDPIQADSEAFKPTMILRGGVGCYPLSVGGQIGVLEETWMPKYCFHNMSGGGEVSETR